MLTRGSKSKTARVVTLSQNSVSRKGLSTGNTVTIEGVDYPDYVGMGLSYARIVVEGKVPTCRYIEMAAERFLAMYEQANAGDGDYYWSGEHAIEPCAFIENLTHVKGVLAKKSFILEPWQIWIIIAIYGFRWKDNGCRVVSIVQLEITRKSGKSLLAAGIAMYELGPNANIGDDLYIIAPTASQAMKVLEPMKKMVRYNPALQEHYGIVTLKERIDVGMSESYAVILSSKGEHQDGHDPKVVIADEFHSLPASIFNVMKSSQGARPESLFLEIGSAGYKAFGVGWDERTLIIEVLEGKRDRPDIFGAIYTIDLEDMGNWKSERVMRKANPNFGVSLDPRKMKQEISGIYTNPRNKNEVLRTRFNIWGLGESKLIPRDAWEACERPEMKQSDYAGKRAWIGVDLATRNDMVCWVLEFFEDGENVVFAQHYVPEDGPWRDDEEVRDLYQQWYEQGHLKFTPGSFHTCDEIFIDLLELAETFDIEVIAIDDREANALMAALAKKNKPVTSFRKHATNYSEPTKDIIAKVVGKTKGLAHNGNPVLAWNVENTIGGMNTAEMLLPKKVSEHSNMKIDGFDAMVMAHAGYMEQIDMSKISKPNPMAERGVRILQ